MSTEAISKAAPDFELVNQHGQLIKLSDFRGKAVVLVFFPLAFSGICQGELCEIRDNISLFQDDEVEVIGISVDSKFALRIWSEQEGYQFNLLSDFWPHGEVAKKYGVFVEERGIANRASFLIDAEGIIRDAIITDPGEARPFDRYREALAKLRAGTN